MTGHVAGPSAGSSGVLFALLADARLPTGAHTQSAGLEPALLAGMPVRDVPAYVAARLATVTRTEAAVAVVARHAALTVPDERVALLRSVWRAWAARTPSPALRETSQRLGRGYLRLAHRLWPTHPAVLALDTAMLPLGPLPTRPRGGGRGERPGAGGDEGAGVRGGRGERGQPPRAVVLGVVAACVGLDGRQVAQLVGYDDAQTIASATLKLAPVDPADATAWVLAAAPLIEEMASSLARLTDPADIPATGAPLLEEWAQQHTHRTERLFSA
ncbi:urease accessory protein UreF [Cellulomonas sp. DKR-3]|uniref:Urease accessory protein UreF n=1 Tax=Cellulomonas fulva TaxID=2835530 RepID=A0ABS5TVG1_9CELL|nr:urease accessory UreF family protein [Cellulomonas fulva]MBT0993121.1 urease accessory protein UreF [Cellulomonas fulva]